ncbi:riboflavin kinase [Pedobacter jamesrossensis]|uniref:riboflavin kinase n=1 Tax=Pedobacter jamesrossensis TaxID=1908238 RepID=UPI00360DC60E
MHFGFTVEEIYGTRYSRCGRKLYKNQAIAFSWRCWLSFRLFRISFFYFRRVIKGDKIGRTIGFPTANIFIEETYKLIPGDGIYAVTVELSSDLKFESLKENPEASTLNLKPSIFKGMAYIGQRPTINGMTRNIEVNIFDFDREIYGQDIKMNFLKFLRHDVKFTGLEALTIQLQKIKKQH